MSNNDARQELAQAFNRNLDPLAEFADTFEATDIDPFGVYADERLATKDLADATIGEYHRSFREWRTYMSRVDRHPACPNEDHVKGFIEYLSTERENAASTIKNRLMYLNNVYKYWQDDAAFPHPTDYNPFDLAKDAVNLQGEKPKEPPRLTVAELRDEIADITHIRDRALVLIQLKLGLRATEVCNIKLSELHLANPDLQDHYDELGSSTKLQGRENVIYIPHDRDGNKSRRPRLLPLDDELRAALVRYLLIRPDTGGSWLFLSKNARTQLRKNDINKVWKAAFHPEYAETDDYRAVTSHFGRHYFTTYWRVEKDLNREKIKYMRGDTAGSSTIENRGAIDEYIHTYFEDIEDTYREEIYKLNV